MKWFKLDCDWYKDDKIDELFRHYGHTGVALYIILLGAIAAKYNGDPDKKIRIAWNWLRTSAGMYTKNFKNCLNFMRKLFEFDLKWHENPNIIEIYYPKFLEKQRMFFKHRRHIDKEEDKEEDTPKPPSGVDDQFWKAYPKKVGKAYAMKCLQRALKKTTIKVILEAIEKQKQSEAWQKDNGAYIPNPSTWLNQGRWEDELTPSNVKPKPDYSKAKWRNMKGEIVQ